MVFSAYAADLWKAIRHEAVPQKLFPKLISSLVVAMMTVVLSVSFVALIFIDPLSPPHRCYCD